VTLLGASLRIGTAFTVQDPCGSRLAAGAACTVSVSFAPTSLGSFKDTLVLQTSAGSVLASVSGTAVSTSAVTLSPARIGFGRVALGNSAAPQAVTLTSTGSTPLNIASIALTGTGQGFTQSNACPAQLAPGAACTIQVDFTAQALGQQDGALSAQSDAGLAPAQVSLTGTGTH